jgi:peptidoglycan hydrolase-like protein with peptidoglycan-binding domain
MSEHKDPEGLDYASVDQNAPPDNPALENAGERFVIIRKSYGYWDSSHRAFRLAADPVYARDAAKARAAGFTVGAYLFPIIHKGAPSAKEQVANFLAAEGDILPGKDFPPTLDVEFPGNGIADTGMTQTEAYDFVVDLATELKLALGVAPMIYTSHVEWCDTNGLGGPPTFPFDCPLWIKIPYHLAAHRAPDTTPHADPHLGFASWDKADLYRIPPPWEKSGWFIRQYQGDAVGLAGVHQADLDDFQITWQGDTGPHIMWLQRKLGVTADGMYGPATATKLEDAQRTHGLEPDGIVGLHTFCVLAWL